ncbi:MAG: pilus assembly protein CpaE [Rhodobacteraceae bacterium]|jgi:pilus assembly protein CpaE|uniref:Pilus assembly protein CpaE n=1 Tax=Salipiger profundus TaxID=1229727 RepID=A0A1U7D149_9RHOB|nr:MULTISPECIES: AAA family ATPase [Salipiger]APX21869.1 pilus assembly protein CpaE [Salipiger profundus]MAB08051.1 pilus assembly protein CpaE [Paracoccaceae bacterium]GGA05876.1 pilus assembly protein CpaE [Salipiger profundus]SFC35190.1 pilus assembly protein CpaE [Salipiger profundus]
MTSTTALHNDPSPIVACTVSRNVQNFDLLIEDMEDLLGEGWGDLGFGEALAFLNQPDARMLEFIALAIDEDDEQAIGLLSEVISAAKARDIKVVLIAEDVTPAALHQLLRRGADEFVPYPLPEGELRAAVDRLRRLSAPAEEPTKAKEGVRLSGGGDGVLIAVQGLSGGCGATTLAVNLAWELANVGKDKAPRVCLLDFDLQFGSVATYLDLPRREAVLELLGDTEAMDGDSFGQALVTYGEKLHVLTSPADVIPMDLLTPQDIKAVLNVAREHFDYVIVDMPRTLVQWTETVLLEAQVYFAMLELDMRSAQNALRLKRALLAEELPFDKIRFALNRAPKFTDLQGKSRAKRMAESLGISLTLQLSDGGKPVALSGDHGVPMAEQAPKNPLRKELVKLASELHAIGLTEAQAA